MTEHQAKEGKAGERRREKNETQMNNDDLGRREKKERTMRTSKRRQSKPEPNT